MEFPDHTEVESLAREDLIKEFGLDCCGGRQDSSWLIPSLPGRIGGKLWRSKLRTDLNRISRTTLKPTARLLSPVPDRTDQHCIGGSHRVHSSGLDVRKESEGERQKISMRRWRSLSVSEGFFLCRSIRFPPTQSPSESLDLSLINNRKDRLGFSTVCLASVRSEAFGTEQGSFTVSQSPRKHRARRSAAKRSNVQRTLSEVAPGTGHLQLSLNNDGPGSPEPVSASVH